MGKGWELTNSRAKKQKCDVHKDSDQALLMFELNEDVYGKSYACLTYKETVDVINNLDIVNLKNYYTPDQLTGMRYFISRVEEHKENKNKIRRSARLPSKPILNPPRREVKARDEDRDLDRLSRKYTDALYLGSGEEYDARTNRIYNYKNGKLEEIEFLKQGTKTLLNANEMPISHRYDLNIKDEYFDHADNYIVPESLNYLRPNRS